MEASHEHLRNKSKAQRIEQHLGKRADIDHAARAIQALQGWNRTSGVTIFRIVFVFDNPGVPARGPIE
jgi:hypothetical protein